MIRESENKNLRFQQAGRILINVLELGGKTPQIKPYSHLLALDHLTRDSKVLQMSVAA